MDGAVRAIGSTSDDTSADKADFGFLPENLVAQCRSLIEGYHDLHGYRLLPDILWKAGLGPFIETHREFCKILKKASTTRSAKKSNEGFVKIATTLLSLEILTSQFAGWATIYPQAASKADAILKRRARGAHTPLMESYLYPPKHISSAAIARLTPQAQHASSDLDSGGVPDLPHAASRPSDDIAVIASSFPT